MSKLAKVVYRPLGLIGGVAAGALAGAVVKQVWKFVSNEEEAPEALQSEYSLRSVLVAAAIHGLIFAVIKAAIDRGGARAFQQFTGEWPGD